MKLSYFFVLLLIGLLFGGCQKVVKVSPDQDKVENLEVEKQENTEIVNENKEDALSENAKVYENFKEGIRVKYPSNWVVQEVNKHGLLAVMFPPEEKIEATGQYAGLYVVVNEETNGLTLEEFSDLRVAQMREQAIAKLGEVEFSEVTLGGKPAHQVILIWPNHKNQFIWTIYNNKEYTLSCRYCENYEQLGREMIDSFEFIQ